ncbi:hypothetical protein SAMN05216388_1017107 [Halorientalis persicus]|uniref:Uncharacterized protein n=1 Tax=Halorientalis persicus TaxID=1367881 RepID=A0A1H8S0P8_9EURY|nr:hypothetical protein [Halorientalis persicus]SEO72261.1 hypothetical protein SAMN05216388_1017107 [Halorientalis persicus]
MQRRTSLTIAALGIVLLAAGCLGGQSGPGTTPTTTTEADETDSVPYGLAPCSERNGDAQVEELRSWLTTRNVTANGTTRTVYRVTIEGVVHNEATDYLSIQPRATIYDDEGTEIGEAIPRSMVLDRPEHLDVRPGSQERFVMGVTTDTRPADIDLRIMTALGDSMQGAIANGCRMTD